MMRSLLFLICCGIAHGDSGVPESCHSTGSCEPPFELDEEVTEGLSLIQRHASKEVMRAKAETEKASTEIEAQDAEKASAEKESHNAEKAGVAETEKAGADKEVQDAEKAGAEKADAERKQTAAEKADAEQKQTSAEKAEKVEQPKTSERLNEDTSFDFIQTMIQMYQERPSALASLPVVATPAFLMLVGSSVAFFGRVPGWIQAATQNFSGGLLISAVAMELYPLMTGKGPQSADLHTTIPICIGFAAGTLFMFGLELITEEDEDEEEEEDEADAKRKLSTMSMKSEPGDPANLALVQKDVENVLKNLEKLKQETREKCNRDELDLLVHSIEKDIHKAIRHSKNSPALDAHNIQRIQDHAEEMIVQVKAIKASEDIVTAAAALKGAVKTLEHIHDHAERVKFGRWKPQPMPETVKEIEDNISWTLVFTVAVDAAVDGLMIGLTFAASAGAGWSMAIATTLEMCFLGLSFSASIQNSTPSKLKHALIVATPPILLVLVGLAGHFLGIFLSQSPLIYIGFIAFAVVALLFLVTQELLAEAREESEDKVVTSMIFVGMWFGIILSKVLSGGSNAAR